MAEVKYRFANGFTLDMAYLAELPGFMSEYEDRFVRCETVNVIISQEIIHNSKNEYSDPIEFSEDKLEVTIKFKMSRYFDNGKLTGLDSPVQFYKTLRFIMDRAVRIDKGEEEQ